MKPNIDISAYNEFAFRYACTNGHIEVAQWLLSVNPDINISAYHDYAFRFACRYEHLEVALWLQSLKPYLYVINITNGIIKCDVRHKEEAKWKRMKYGLWLQSENTNTNIINVLPIDISKGILAYCS